MSVNTDFYKILNKYTKLHWYAQVLYYATHDVNNPYVKDTIESIAKEYPTEIMGLHSSNGMVVYAFIQGCLHIIKTLGVNTLGKWCFHSGNKPKRGRRRRIRGSAMVNPILPPYQLN